MKSYHIRLELRSPALVGSGEGSGAIIDSDIVFDDIGIPYIPAKRIKGCLLDSTNEIREMFDFAKIKFEIAIPDVFGEIGAKRSAPVYFSDLMIENYTENRAWLEYFLHHKNYQFIISKDAILNTFTEIRQQTRIDENNGVAFEGSLRTLRLIKKGVIFTGEVFIEDPNIQIPEILALACMNLRHFGTSRNRGFGEIRCRFMDGNQEVLNHERLEEICTS